MAKRLYVGNLPYEITQDQLQKLFAEAGAVETVDVITDKMTGRAKGFAFVDMATEKDAQEAIKKYNGYSLDDRTLVVNEARPREERTGGGGGFGGRGGYGGRDNRRSY
jgi:RNA recognition motif-containing protein